ncbi:MAG: SRPBCC family protein [Chlorobi bacterium]|nr:SRPBCC family protein [Chlorobiota bacterium]
MTKFESAIKEVPYSAETIYNFLSDFDNFGEVIPQDKIKNWQSFGDHCTFEIDMVGEVGLRIVETNPHDTIKYVAEGNTPVNFFLWIQIKEVAEGDSRIKLTIKAELNPMIKMVASGPIKTFLEVLADGIASHKYE